ncbi:MAG: cation diffusion facilitator family transporter [Pseudomonadota bacterium]
MRETNEETNRLLILSGVLDLVLGLLKIIVGFLASSHALIADGVHSLSDLGTDIMVWLFNRVGIQAPDEQHPYGHGRFETLGTFLLGGILILVAGFIVYESVGRLMDISEVDVPTWPALIVAALSIVAKEWLFYLTRRLGEKIRSNLLIANAWHHRSDALSSVIVLIGVAGAMLGILWFEMLAAIGVALMIAQIGWKLLRQSVDELVDTAQSEAYVQEIEKSIVDVEGVRGVHSIRTRRMGPDVLVELHLQVEPGVSVSEGHHIGEWVSKGLLSDYDEINDVIVHIDAEDDELLEPREGITSIPPLRREIRIALADAWRPLIAASDIRKLTLHYLNNRVNVELFLDRRLLTEQAEQAEQTSNLASELVELGRDLPWLGKVTVWYD